MAQLDVESTISPEANDTNVPLMPTYSNALISVC